jgi:hypothetical protein
MEMRRQKCPGTEINIEKQMLTIFWSTSRVVIEEWFFPHGTS